MYLGTDVLAESGDDTTTGFGFSVARGIDGLDPQRAGADAVERALRMLGAASAPSERLTVVFDPYVTSQLLGVIAEMLSGDAVLRGRSPFAGRVGEVVAAPGVTLLDDATRAASPAASDIDGEGLACRPVPLIEDGVLSGFLHNAYTARASGTVSTGSAQRPSHRGGPWVGPHVATVVPGDLTSPRRSSPASATASWSWISQDSTRGSTLSRVISRSVSRGCGSAAASSPNPCVRSPSPPPCSGC